MGGLGNGRRGGRSPPLMIGALVACILVLGFNYWVSSSRNLDLQTKLYELEGQLRRGAAEKGVVEIKKNEYQEEIQKQKEQIDNMESMLKRQLEQVQSTCSHQKAALQQNISSSTKTIQELKVQLNQLNDDLPKLQNKLQSCQGNINTLNNKLTYDMTNCNSQLLSQKELCDERVASAKLEVQKKMETYIASQQVLSKQANAVGGAIKENDNTIPGADATAVSHTQNLTQAKGNETPKELTKNVIVGKVPDEPVELPSSKDITKSEPQPVTKAAAVKEGIVPPPEGAVKTHHDEAETRKLTKNNPSEDKGVELMDTHEQGAQTEDNGMEDMLIAQGKADKTENGQKMEDALEYDADDQAVGGEDLEKQQQRKPAENLDREMEEELADYNGDNENEGEFEADKQAELAQI